MHREIKHNEEFIKGMLRNQADQQKESPHSFNQMGKVLQYKAQLREARQENKALKQSKWIRLHSFLLLAEIVVVLPKLWRKLLDHS